MNKIFTILIISLFFGPGMLLAADMDMTGHTGKMIRNTKVEGYGFMYHLIDMSEQMKTMPDMKASHHMMVYVVDPDGRNVENAKVGYLVKDPDGTVQKIMTMNMGSGFGADISLKDKGTYIIKTKVLIGEKALMDEFEYTVE